MEPRESTMNLSTGKLFIRDPETGETRELGNVEMGEIKFNETADNMECIIPIRTGESACMSFEARCYLPRMSRKRFIKLLMAMRFQRNAAYELAAFCNRKGYSYNVSILGLRFMGY